MKWVLERIYSKPCDPHYEADLNECQRLVADMSAIMGNSFSSIDLLPLLDKLSFAYELADKLKVYLELTLMLDAGDLVAKETLISVDALVEDVQNIKYGLANKYAENPNIFHSVLINEKYKGLLLELKQLSRYPSILHHAISVMRLTGSGAWRGFRTEKMSEVQVKENKSFGVLQTIIRGGSVEEADEAFLQDVMLSQKAAADSLTALRYIKTEFLNRCKLYNFSSPLDYMLDLYRIEHKLFNSIMSEAENVGNKAVNELMAVTGKDRLKLYELDRVGDSFEKIEYSDCIRIVKDCFAARSQELKELIENVEEEMLIDNEPRKGKRSGACIISLHACKQSYILTNDTGSARAIISLAHEMGHCYHHSKMFQNPIVENNSPMIINEFISKFFELWISDYLADAGIMSSSLIKELRLKGQVQTFCQTMARYYFESDFFLALDHGEINLDNTSYMMKKAQLKAFCGKLDPAYSNPYEWVTKPHYYYTDIALYNFPYIIGNILALKYYEKFKTGNLQLNEIGIALAQSGRIESFQEFLNIVGVFL